MSSFTYAGSWLATKDPSPARAISRLYASLIGYLNDLSETTDGAVALLDREQRVVLLTPDFRKLAGLPDIFSGQPLDLLLDACSRRLAEGSASLKDFRLQAGSTEKSLSASCAGKNGEEIHLLLEPVHDPLDGSRQGWLFQISQAAGEDDLGALLVHELRRPLQGIVSSAELLEREGADASQMPLIETIKTSGHSISGSLRAVRLLTGKETLCPEPFRVADIFIDLHRIFTGRPGTEEIRFRFGNDMGFPRAGEPAVIRQVLLNLIENAIRHAGGEIEVWAGAEEDGFARFAVKDSGPGIAPEQAERIFSAGVSLGGGSGLGLFIVSELLRKMGGEINLESSPRGSVFSFRIPLPKVSRDRVLIVDDDAISLEMLAREIEILGYSPLSAATAEEAVRLWQQMPVDLVMIDALLKDRSGFDLALEIRKSSPGTPLVSISGLPRGEDFFLAQGFNAHLGKPITLDRLERTLARLIGPGPSPEMSSSLGRPASV